MSPPELIRVSLEEALKLLEITDLESLTVEELDKIKRKAKNRWHPDRVSHLNDIIKTERYTENFKKVEASYKRVKLHIEGQEIHKRAGFETTSAPSQSNGSSQENGQYKHPPHKDTRSQESVYSAAFYQQKLKEIWASVKKSNYKQRKERVVLSEGFSLKELLFQDLSDDMPVLAIISLVYGFFLVSLLAIPVFVLFNILQLKPDYFIVAIYAIFALCSVLAFLPLSRFWLPDSVSTFVLAVVNIGLKFYNYLRGEGVQSGIVMAFVYIPELIAKVLKFVIIYPIYWLVGYFLGHLRIGKIEKDIRYYGDAAEWYIDELLVKAPADFSDENLRHIQLIYESLKGVKSKMA